MNYYQLLWLQYAKKLYVGKRGKNIQGHEIRGYFVEINEERSNLPAIYIFPWTEKEREGKRGGVQVLGLLFLLI